MKRLKSGDFADLAVFERQTEAGASDSYGRIKTTAWTELLTEWASVRETPGREIVSAGSLEANATATMLVRHSTAAASVTAKDRVRVRGAYWNVIGAPITKSGRPRLLEFLIRRGVAI